MVHGLPWMSPGVNLQSAVDDPGRDSTEPAVDHDEPVSTDCCVSRRPCVSGPGVDSQGVHGRLPWTLGVHDPGVNPERGEATESLFWITILVGFLRVMMCSSGEKAYGIEEVMSVPRKSVHRDPLPKRSPLLVPVKMGNLKNFGPRPRRNLPQTR